MIVTTKLLLLKMTEIDYYIKFQEIVVKEAFGVKEFLLMNVRK